MAMKQFRELQQIFLFISLFIQNLMVSSLPIQQPAMTNNSGNVEFLERRISQGACPFLSEIDYRCDEEPDCLDFADERGCGACHGMEFLCASYGRPQCLSESRVCDGRRDCDDGSDEHLCGRLIPDPGNFNEYEPIRRKGFIQMKREGKWRNVCFEKFTSGGYRILIVMLKDLCKDIAGEKRCGRETVLLKNIESSYINRNQNFDSSIFVKLEFAGGSLAGSCRSSLVGYLECGQPCPQQHRNRRDASDALEAPSSANISPRTAPLQPNPTAPQQQDAGQEEDAHWEQMSQRLLQQEKEQGQMDSRIVGGDSANRKEWPFIVSMNYRGEHFCGGSIITAEWVLTAAHCLFSIKGSLHKIVIEVQAGMLRRLSWSPYEQTSTVSHALFHPEYNQYSSDNDIMLIKLTTPFHLNRWVQTVDLAQSGEVSQRMCSVAGWGVTMENGNLPNELQTVDVPLHDKCPKSYRVPDSNFLCAGYQQGGMDSCQGDSGGPMMCKSKNKAWELYGVVSFGIGCARRGYPGAYTKVPTYYNWIMRSMSGTSHMVAARKTCKNKCWRKIGSCLHSSRCRERNDCWDVQKRCNRGLNISTADLQFHRSSLPLSPPVKIQFTKPCPEGMASCVTSDECYFPNQRCDREINCNDLSDEMNCTCLMHTATEYLCDGYPDCPDFSDELKCAAQDKGCSEGGMWCTPAGTCVNKDKLCDGIQDCEDNSDEHLCMRLVSDPHDSSDTFILKGKGFLQVRAMEQWLPFCPTRDQSHAALVASVCTDIVGHSSGSHTFKLESIQISDKPRSYTWTKLSASSSSKFIMTNTCDSNLGLLAMCAEPKCEGQHPNHARRRRDGFNFISAPSGRLVNSKSFHGLGSRAGLANNMTSMNVEPETWGFLVVILREGLPTCLGSILDSWWILTSATCVKEYHQYFYEVKAGMLRRNSTSPYEQVSSVTHISIVEDGELALLRVTTPFHLNRWVRPMCAVHNELVEINTDCVIAGWTNIQEERTYDHLQQVSLQTESCSSKHNDSVLCVTSDEVEKSCASVPGAPLMCRRDEEWHLGGVSLGECTEESGIFTRISSFTQWIEHRESYTNRNSSSFPKGPKPKCALGTCSTVLGSCQSIVNQCNMQVDCLDLEDESGCVKSLGPSLEEQDVQSPQAAASNASPQEGQNPAEAAIAQLMLGLGKPAADEAQTDVVSNATEIRCQDNEFKCRVIPECIQVRRRCDGTPQCRDQSDEHRCSCLDRLRSVKPHLENDGFYDCFDGSDESVRLCPGFLCETSRQCIAMSKVCDGGVDCQFGEDEINCIGLVSAAHHSSLSGLLDLSEQRSPVGMLMWKDGISWKPVCLESISAELVKEICPYLGYSSDNRENNQNISDPIDVLYEKDTRMPFNSGSIINFPRKLKDEDPYWQKDVQSSSTGHQLTNHGFLRLLQDIRQQAGSKVSCKSEVKCGEEQCGIVPRFLFTEDIPVWKLGGVPWAGAVYVDGQYKCGATLVQPSWVISSAACMNGTKITESHVVVVMGSWRKVGTPTRLWGAYEHGRKVDYMTAILKSDIILLHLRERMPKSHYINPVCLPNSLPDIKPNSSCVIAGLSEDDDRLSLGIQFQVADTCTGHELCVADDLSKAPFMRSWAGVIACKIDSGVNPLWTGVGMWSHGRNEGNGSQPYQHPMFTEENLKAIFSILAATDMSRPPVPDICKTDTCAMGICVGQQMICDMKLDCPDLADEPSTCPVPLSLCTPDNKTKTCACDGVLCPDNVCVPFNKMCDGIAHCLDGSDEINCTCTEWLQRVDGGKVCDGIIDCEDQGDESQCGCSEQSEFRCYNSSQACVKEDLVCDGKRDCTDGEDEKHCLALSPWVFVAETVLGAPQRNREGFLLVRIRGRWFTYDSEHWAKNTYLSDHLCQSLGYPNAVATLSRSLSMERMNEINNTFSNGTHPNPAKFDTSLLLPREDEETTSVVYVVCSGED